MQTYARELLRELPGALDATYLAVVARDAVDELPPDVIAMPRPAVDGARRSLAALRSFGPADLVHGLDVELPLRPGAPTVTTVHDLSVLDMPWAYSRAKQAWKRFSTKLAVERADAVISVSAFTAERVRDHFGRDSVVVHEAPAPEFVPPSPGEVDAVRARYDLPAAFVLHVGNLEPRKDVPSLAAACERAGLPLVLSGAAISTVAPPANARLIGYVDRGELPALYAGATVVAYVSRYEGFGLPPVEALACGATVMATPVGALPDVAGDGIAFVPVGDVDAQARTLRELSSDDDRRRALAEAGLRCAQALSWSEAAARTVDVYRSLGVGSA